MKSGAAAVLAVRLRKSVIFDRIWPESDNRRLYPLRHPYQHLYPTKCRTSLVRPGDVSAYVTAKPLHGRTLVHGCRVGHFELGNDPFADDFIS